MRIYDVKYVKRAFGALFCLLRKVGRKNMVIEVKNLILCKPYGIIKSTPRILLPTLLIQSITVKCKETYGKHSLPEKSEFND